MLKSGICLGFPIFLCTFALGIKKDMKKINVKRIFTVGFWLQVLIMIFRVHKPTPFLKDWWVYHTGIDGSVVYDNARTLWRYLTTK